MSGLPPTAHRAETEKALLGAILVNTSALPVVSGIVGTSDFFTPEYRIVFAAMQRLADSGAPIEIITLYDALKENQAIADAGGAGFIAALGDGVHDKAPVEHWANMVRDSATLRSLAHAGESLRDAALAPRARVEDVLEFARTSLTALGNPLSSGHVQLVSVAVEQLLTKDIRPREMLLDPILPEQSLAMLYSYRGIGKTFISLGIAGAVASGSGFLRWKGTRPRRVLYIDGELPAATLKERVAMVVASLDTDVPPEMLRLVTPDLQPCPMPDLAMVAGQRLIEPMLEGVELVILDNLSALCRCGENEGEDWLPVQGWALGLRRRGISVLFVHHSGKNRQQRGTSRREDLLDTVITLKHPADYQASEGLRCELHFEKTRAMLGEAAKPFEVKLEKDPEGRATWTMLDLNDAKFAQASALFEEGMHVRDVAEELGISRSSAGRLRKRWQAGASHVPAV